MTSSSHAPAVPAAGERPFPWAGLIVLSLAVFLSITGETMPMGLLPEMSADFGVSEGAIGLLVTVFAFTVVVTSTPVTAATARVPRHTLMLIVIVVLAIANGLTAVAPSYELILASRVIGGLAHGVFWALVAAYAARLVPPALIGRAVSITLTGGSLAFVIGVPLGTALGHAVGWRWAFAGVAGVLAVCALAVWFVLPRVGAASDGSSAPLERVPARQDPTLVPALLVCAGVALMMIGHYVVYTYIAPYLQDVVGVAPAALSLWLLAFGLAGLVGLFLSGTVLGRRPRGGLVLVLCVLIAAVIALWAFSSGSSWLVMIAFVVWGVAFGAMPPMMQTRLLQTASASLRDIASAFYTTAFNIGIGGGALLGSVLLGGWGLGSLPLVNAALAAAGLAVVLISFRRARRLAAASASAS